ncbi:MAG: hypothetical protein JXM73_04420 [Anaerolineae bacterium]|nr:hypothetical protein [Anaerolineae bacterium]
MKRIGVLSLFLIRDLFRSLAGLVPVAAGFTFYGIAFEYGMDQPQFVTVAGVGLGATCLLTALLLTGRANRASFYPFIARLPQRSELLAAVVIGSLAVTAIIALLMTEAALLQHKLSLDFPSVLWIIPTWLALWLLMAALALPLSSLASRDGSHMVGYMLITALLVANDRRAFLEEHRLRWLSRAVTATLWPIATLLSRASAGIHDRSYLLAMVLTVAYAGILFGLATALLKHKDLLWPE